MCGVQDMGSSPGCCSCCLRTLPPPAQVVVQFPSGTAQLSPSLSFHFYTTVCRSDAFIAKQLLEWRLERHNTQCVGSEVCLSDGFS